MISVVCWVRESGEALWSRGLSRWSPRGASRRRAAGVPPFVTRSGPAGARFDLPRNLFRLAAECEWSAWRFGKSSTARETRNRLEFFQSQRPDVTRPPSLEGAKPGCADRCASFRRSRPPATLGVLGPSSATKGSTLQAGRSRGRGGRWVEDRVFSWLFATTKTGRFARKLTTCQFPIARFFFFPAPNRAPGLLPRLKFSPTAVAFAPRRGGPDHAGAVPIPPSNPGVQERRFRYVNSATLLSTRRVRSGAIAVRLGCTKSGLLRKLAARNHGGPFLPHVV